eukprot:1988747-Karenia_brevis.AAC.1
MLLSSSSQGPPQSSKIKSDCFRAPKNQVSRSLLSISEDPVDPKSAVRKSGDCASPTINRDAVGSKMQNLYEYGLAGTPGIGDANNNGGND